jgi:hypothetical protein
MAKEVVESRHVAIHALGAYVTMQAVIKAQTAEDALSYSETRAVDPAKLCTHSAL